MRRVVATIGILGALVLVPAAPAGAGGDGCYREYPDQSRGSGTAVEIVHFCFSPAELHVDVGETVTFNNRDPLTHVVQGVGWTAGGELDEKGDSATFTFRNAGLFPYTCYLHPGMNGVIVVGDGGGEATELAADVGPTSLPGDESDGVDVAPVVAGAGVAGVAGFAGGRWARRRL